MLRFSSVCAALVALAGAGPAWAGRDITVDDIYQRFNIRSIFSSYGPRLQYYCQSYLKDYFAPGQMVERDAKSLTLASGDDVWEIRIVAANRIVVGNLIKSGTYRSAQEYVLDFYADAGEWRARETFIPVPPKCVNYRPGQDDGA